MPLQNILNGLPPQLACLNETRIRVRQPNEAAASEVAKPSRQNTPNPRSIGNFYIHTEKYRGQNNYSHDYRRPLTDEDGSRSFLLKMSLHVGKTASI
jgi:hypothetical protein